MQKTVSCYVGLVLGKEVPTKAVSGAEAQPIEESAVPGEFTYKPGPMVLWARAHGEFHQPPEAQPLRG